MPRVCVCDGAHKGCVRVCVCVGVQVYNMDKSNIL